MVVLAQKGRDASGRSSDRASTLAGVTIRREPTSRTPTASANETAILAPSGALQVPPYDAGWVCGDGARKPFLSYVNSDPSVNWSADLEALHEEASRTHFIDCWTRAAIVERIGELSPTATIADIGCSTGYLLEDLASAYPEATLIGIDLIAAGLHKAHRAVPAARLLHADACELPLADRSVDAVVSANLLEHISDDRLALSEIARVLRAGARAVLVVPAGARTYDYYDRFLGHERRYGRGELASKCAAVGLEPLDDLHLAALLYPAFWSVKKRNQLLHRDLRGEALEARVAADIAKTRDSRLGRFVWQVENRLVGAGMRLPFGVRSLVVARQGAVA
jgi:SAM-dependent methyltransferase